MDDYQIYIKIAGAIIISIVINTALRWIIKLIVNKYAKKIHADATSFSFLKNSIGFLVYIAAIIYIVYQIPGLKNIGTALFASAGILAAIIGFASQKAFANIIGGIFILIFRPFRVGDVIYIGSVHKGVVEEITLRHIVIRNYEYRRIIIPNSIISDETVVNSTIADEKIKKQIDFRIDFKSDLDKAIQIIREEAERHPLAIDNRSPEQVENNKPKVVIRVLEIGEYFIQVRAYVWAKDTDDAFILSCDMNYNVKKRFDQNGIEIPYPYRNIVSRNL